MRTYHFLFWIFFRNKAGGVVYISYYNVNLYWGQPGDFLLASVLNWLTCNLTMNNMMAGKGPVSHYISWVYMLLIVTCSWDWSIYSDKVHHGIRWNAFNNLILVEVLICMIRWEGSHWIIWKTFRTSQSARLRILATCICQTWLVSYFVNQVY